MVLKDLIINKDFVCVKNYMYAMHLYHEILENNVYSYHSSWYCDILKVYVTYLIT